MATDSLIGYQSATAIAPAPSGKTDSLIAYQTVTITAPPAPYTDSLIGFASVTLAPPAANRKNILVLTDNGWQRSGILIFDGEVWSGETVNPSLGNIGSFDIGDYDIGT